MNDTTQERLAAAAQASLRREFAKALAVPLGMLVTAAGVLAYLTAAGYAPF